MASQFTPYDLEIAKSMVLEVDVSNPSDAGYEVYTESVMFQFPLIIASDDKSLSWDEKKNRTMEPQVVISSAEARSITVETKYILGMGGWSTSQVKGELDKLRKYFYLLDSRIEKALIARVFLCGYGGRDKQTFRLISLSITPSKTMVVLGERSYQGIKRDYTNTHPLRVDVRIEMKLWTNVESKSDIPGLIDRPYEGWY